MSNFDWMKFLFGCSVGINIGLIYIFIECYHKIRSYESITRFMLDEKKKMMKNIDDSDFAEQCDKENVDILKKW